MLQDDIVSKRNKPKSDDSSQTVQTTLDYNCVDESPNGNTTIPYGLIRAVKSYLEFMVRKKLGPRAGFFKLESSVPLDAAEVLRRYRQRGIVEQTIGSLKKITGIKPIRVWSDNSIEGSMILALLAEAVVSMIRYCVGKHYKSIDKRSKSDNEHHPSTRKLAVSLGHLTLTRFKDSKGQFDSKLSNWDELSKAIYEDIHAHEAPEWGLKKVPLGPNATA